MKADKEKQLIEAMKSKYQCRVTAEDIIKQTDFFDNRSSRKVNKFFNYKITIKQNVMKQHGIFLIIEKLQLMILICKITQLQSCFAKKKN